MNNNNHNNRFMDGFLLGAAVGGAAVFLLGTKKGNKVLKILTEEGLDGLTSLLDQLDSAPSKPILPKVKEPEVKDKKEEPEEIHDDFEDKITMEVPSSNGLNHNHHPQPKRFFRKK